MLPPPESRIYGTVTGRFSSNPLALGSRVRIRSGGYEGRVGTVVRDDRVHTVGVLVDGSNMGTLSFGRANVERVDAITELGDLARE